MSLPHWLRRLVYACADPAVRAECDRLRLQAQAAHVAARKAEAQRDVYVDRLHDARRAADDQGRRLSHLAQEVTRLGRDNGQLTVQIGRQALLIEQAEQSRDQMAAEVDRLLSVAATLERRLAEQGERMLAQAVTHQQTIAEIRGGWDAHERDAIALFDGQVSP